MDDETIPQEEGETDEVMFTNYFSAHFVDAPHILTEEKADQDFRIGGGRL